MLNVYFIANHALQLVKFTELQLTISSCPITLSAKLVVYAILAPDKMCIRAYRSTTLFPTLTEV
jgi:hypothetical protein